MKKQKSRLSYFNIQEVIREEVTDSTGYQEFSGYYMRRKEGNFSEKTDSEIDIQISLLRLEAREAYDEQHQRFCCWNAARLLHKQDDSVKKDLYYIDEWSFANGIDITKTKKETELRYIAELFDQPGAAFEILKKFKDGEKIVRLDGKSVSIKNFYNRLSRPKRDAQYNVNILLGILETTDLSTPTIPLKSSRLPALDFYENPGEEDIY